MYSRWPLFMPDEEFKLGKVPRANLIIFACLSVSLCDPVSKCYYWLSPV